MKKSSFLVIALLTSSGVMARPVYDITMYQPVFSNGSYQAVINYNGASTSVASSNMADGGARITQFMNRVSGFYWSLRDDLSAGIRAGIAGSGANMLDNGGLTGDISMSAVGMSNGNLQLNAGGLSYSVNIQAKKSNLLGSFTCTSQISLNNIQLASQYNPYTGAVSATTINYTPAQSTSCDSSYSWIPFIGDFINNKIGNKVGALILSGMSGWSGKVLSVNPQNAFLGFAEAITPGAHMVGNFDAGMYVKNNLPNLYIGKRVDLFAANDYKYEPHSQRSPGAPSYRGNRFAITFSDGSNRISFGVDAVKNYSWQEYVIPGTNGPEN